MITHVLNTNLCDNLCKKFLKMDTYKEDLNGTDFNEGIAYLVKDSKSDELVCITIRWDMDVFNSIEICKFKNGHTWISWISDIDGEIYTNNVITLHDWIEFENCSFSLEDVMTGKLSSVKIGDFLVSHKKTANFVEFSKSKCDFKCSLSVNACKKMLTKIFTIYNWVMTDFWIDPITNRFIITN